MKELMQEVIVILQPLLMTALTAAVAMAVKWLQARTHNEKVRAIEARLAESVMTIVKSTSMTLVDKMKAAKADGKITPEERAEIKAAALAEIKGYWGQKGITEVKKVLGYADDTELSNALSHDIEEAVFNMKMERVAAGESTKLPV